MVAQVRAVREGGCASGGRSMEIDLVKGKNHVNGPTSIEMGLDDFSQFRSSTPE